MTEHYTHEDGSAALALPDLTEKGAGDKESSAAVLAAILPMLTSIDDKATLRKLQKSIEARIRALGA